MDVHRTSRYIEPAVATFLNVDITRLSNSNSRLDNPVFPQSIQMWQVHACSRSAAHTGKVGGVVFGGMGASSPQTIGSSPLRRHSNSC